MAQRVKQLSLKDDKLKKTMNSENDNKGQEENQINQTIINLKISRFTCIMILKTTKHKEKHIHTYLGLFRTPFAFSRLKKRNKSYGFFDKCLESNFFKKVLKFFNN